MPAQLKHGVIGAPGGARKGAGRPFEWLKLKCQAIVDKRKLIEFLADVAAGKNMEQVVTDKGEVLQVPASVKDRIKATEILLDKGFGKNLDPTSTTQFQSVINADAALRILKELEKNANDLLP